MELSKLDLKIPNKRERPPLTKSPIKMGKNRLAQPTAQSLLTHLSESGLLSTENCEALQWYRYLLLLSLRDANAPQLKMSQASHHLRKSRSAQDFCPDEYYASSKKVFVEIRRKLRVTSHNLGIFEGVLSARTGDFEAYKSLRPHDRQIFLRTALSLVQIKNAKI